MLANIEARYRKSTKYLSDFYINVVFVLINKKGFMENVFNFVNFNQECINILNIQMSRQVQSEK